jgi:hypothetical protein
VLTVFLLQVCTGNQRPTDAEFKSLGSALGLTDVRHAIFEIARYFLTCVRTGPSHWQSYYSLKDLRNCATL